MLTPRQANLDSQHQKRSPSHYATNASSHPKLHIPSRHARYCRRLLPLSPQLRSFVEEALGKSKLVWRGAKSHSRIHIYINLMSSPRSSIESTNSTTALIESHPHRSQEPNSMAIFSSNKQQQEAPVDKTHMEYSEDLEARRSHSKSDNGRIERVELTAEDVCGVCYTARERVKLIVMSGQIDLSKDRQGHSSNPGLGVLSPGMIC